MSSYLVTGASGQLGRLVIAHLKTLVPAGDIVALVRRPEAAAEFEAQGIAARIADYTDPAALTAALAGIDRMLLISASEVGRRAPQHRNAIDAAKAAGVGFIAYTSILHADRATMQLAEEHRATEAMLAESGIPHALLRNGWYSENLLAALPTDLSLGKHFGAAGTGRFSTAPRHDFAEAAALVLAGPGHEGKTYELAGDTAVTLAEFAALLSAAAGKTVDYVDLPEAAYAEALIGAGLPAALATALADSDARAAEGELYDASGTLSALIGHPTEPMAETIRRTLG